MKILILSGLLTALAPFAKAQVTVPPWLDRAMGYTLHTVGYYNSADHRAPTYYSPLRDPFLTFPGHPERLARALAQKSRRFGAALVRVHVPMPSLQPAPGAYDPMDFQGRLIAEFQRQGIGVVLQVDGPPSFLSPVATDSFARSRANQPTNTPRASVVPDTDLAFYDELWDRMLEPAQRLSSPFKPAGELRIVISGRNEPRGRYQPANHPLSIPLRGGGGEWERLTERLRWNDERDGRRDLVIGSIETLGTSNALPIDAYTTHDYVGIGFVDRNQINILTEVNDWLAFPLTDASLKYQAIQRSFGQTARLYVAHLVDDLDLGARLRNGSPRGEDGKFWSDTQPRTTADLNLDTWNEPMSAFAGSRVEDLRQAHPWLTARAANTVDRELHDLVITHQAIPFYLPGTHPDSGSSYGFELPSRVFSFDVHVRNLGRASANVRMESDGHNFASLSFQPSQFTLPVDGVQRVTVTFDATNAPREGFHGGEVRATIEGAPKEVFDRIPIVVLSDVDKDPNANRPLIGSGVLQYRANESTADLASYTEGTERAVYRVPAGMAFAPSHLRVHVGGVGSSNYNADVLVECWDEARGTWDSQRALHFRVDGNIQDLNPYARSFPEAPSSMRFVRLDWPLPHWSVPVLSHVLELDGRLPLTGLRVTIRSLDDPNFPETHAKQTRLEIFGRTWSLPGTVPIRDAFSTRDPAWTDPDGGFSTTSGTAILMGTGHVRSTYREQRWASGRVSARVRPVSSSWASLRFEMERVDDPVEGPLASGLDLRVRPLTTGTSLELWSAGNPATRLAGTTVPEDARARLHRLAVTMRDDLPGREYEVFWEGRSVLSHLRPGTNAHAIGHVGIASFRGGQAGTSHFDDLEVDPAPYLTHTPRGALQSYLPGAVRRVRVVDRLLSGQPGLDLNASMAQGGLGLEATLALFGLPGSVVTLPLSWTMLTNEIFVDPLDGSLGLELHPLLLPAALALSAGTPVVLRWQAVDVAGNRAVATFLYR